MRPKPVSGMYAQRWSPSGGSGPPVTQLFGVHANRASVPDRTGPVLLPCSTWTQSRGSPDGEGEHESWRTFNVNPFWQPFSMASESALAPPLEPPHQTARVLLPLDCTESRMRTTFSMSTD